MSQAETTSTIESRAIPNTVVFGFVKALALELSQGRVDLPSVPDIVVKMQRVMADENVSNETVVKVLSAEPVLASKLLNMANSAALNASGRKIADLRMAVARVGFNIVRSAALSLRWSSSRARRSSNTEPMLDALETQCTSRRCRTWSRGFTSLNGDTALLAA
jgi:HD-like signal output (HDOD) protein